MRIAIGCDHGGFLLKTEVMAHLKSKGFECKDFGTYSEESCDYPDISIKVAESVVSKECELGVLVCGTGIGISIAANKVPGVRAALCGDTFSAKATRQHNNANILALGQRVTGTGLALEIVDAFFSSEFEGGRHENRISKISAIEEKYSK